MFAKHWTPGETKTRLAKTIGPRDAAQVSHALLTATLDRLAMLLPRIEPARLTVAYTPAERVDDFRTLVAGLAVECQLVPQPTGDLGERLERLLAPTADSGGVVIGLGSDCPHFPVDAVAEAATWLRGATAGRGAALGPSEDGGYWLVGLRGAPPSRLFRDTAWGGTEVFKTALMRLNEAGWRRGVEYAFVSSCYDVDDAEGLARLRATKPGDDALAQLAERLDSLLGKDTAP